jgi:HSP20 family molecular chaperone IbpA
MNTESNKTVRTNKTTTTVIIGVITLAIGLVIGVAAAESSARVSGAMKVANTPTNQMSLASSSNPTPGVQNEWNPFQEIRDMQAQMDQSFDQMFQQFSTNPQFNIFKENSGYSLSLNVRDLKNRYVVRAFLPDAKASDVHVSLKNGQTLNVEVNSQQTNMSNQKNTEASVTESGQYEQMIQLPTPVKADQMEITREGHELVITIPKAA